MTPSERIPVAGPSITEKEIRYVTDAVSRCWFERANEYHERFERAMADWLGVRHAVALPSCTSAIHLALAAWNIGAGDEVIVPDLTWIASSAPIDYVGATPVFADVDPRTWCVSTDAFERLISPRTKALIAVDLYGSVPDMDALMRTARRHGIHVIEDAAEAFGSTYHGRRAGSLGDVGVFSFHGSKTLTTGEGGMLVTDDDALCARVLFLRDHGRLPGDVRFQNAEVAFKYKMSSMQAALGLAQLERAAELVERKRRIFQWYAEAFADWNEVTLNPCPDGVENAYWMVTLLFDAAWQLDKYELMQRLQDRHIDCRPFFPPLSSLPAYAGRPQASAARRRNRHAYRLSPLGVNLPSALSLEKRHVERVVTAVRQAAPVAGRMRDSA